MELTCIEGPVDTGKRKISLPNTISLEKLNLFECDSSGEKPRPENKDNIENANQVKVKRIGHEFNLSEIAYSAKNIECMKDKYQYFMGEGEKKIFIGPVLQVIERSTYSKITGNKSVHFDKNPLNEKGKFLYAKDREIAITPANEDVKDFLIVIFENGCIIVAAGAFLVFNLPIVVVKSNGTYFTISDGPRNIIMLRKGLHLILYTKLDTSFPIVLLRGTQDIRQIEPEKPLELSSEKPLEGISSEKSYEKQLPEPEVDIEKIEMKENEFVDTKYIPKYIVCWINVKGYELEIEGAKSILGISSHSIVRRGKRISDSKPIAAKVILAGMDELSKRNNKPPQELFFAKKVDHQSIVKVLDIFCVMAQRVQNHDTMFSFIIMELANNSLDKVIKREGKLIEDNAKQVFQQIASAVLYLHTNYIAHCNIRLDNCLVFDNNVIKLCDFSRAENIFLRLDGQLSNKFSSLKYMPPEFYESENFELLKIDIWMSACLLYSLLSANLSPFGDLKKDDLIAKTETFQSFRNRQNDGLPQDIVVSDKGKDLLIQMFKTNPNERINARQVFSNDWLK